MFATVSHTGKDLDPELKGLFTLSSFSTLDFYRNWPADADMPTDRLFSGMVKNLKPVLEGLDSDRAAPWTWNLKPELFARALDWPDCLTGCAPAAPLTNRPPTNARLFGVR
jgi:hypothetical protein